MHSMRVLEIVNLNKIQILWNLLNKWFILVLNSGVLGFLNLSYSHAPGLHVHVKSSNPMVIYILYTPLVREHVYSGTYIIVDIEDSYVVTLKTGHIY